MTTEQSQRIHARHRVLDAAHVAEVSAAIEKICGRDGMETQRALEFLYEAGQGRMPRFSDYTQEARAAWQEGLLNRDATAIEPQLRPVLAAIIIKTDLLGQPGVYDLVPLTGEHMAHSGRPTGVRIPAPEKVPDWQAVVRKAARHGGALAKRLEKERENNRNLPRSR